MDAVRLLSLPAWMGRHPKASRSAFRCRTEIDVPTADQRAHSQYTTCMAIRWTKHTGECKHAGGAASHSLQARPRVNHGACAGLLQASACLMIRHVQMCKRDGELTVRGRDGWLATDWLQGEVPCKVCFHGKHNLREIALCACSRSAVAWWSRERTGC
jgi:hypothetical protein